MPHYNTRPDPLHLLSDRQIVQMLENIAYIPDQKAITLTARDLRTILNQLYMARAQSGHTLEIKPAVPNIYPDHALAMSDMQGNHRGPEQPQA